jgi:hypothetical protein
VEQDQGPIALCRSTHPQELDEAISQAFSKITANDAAGYLASFGYSIL